MPTNILVTPPTMTVKQTNLVKAPPKTQQYTLEVLVNGTQEVTPDGDYTGLSKVTVNTNVLPVLQDKSVEITSNGVQAVSTDSGYVGMSNVEITTNVQPVTEEKTVQSSQIQQEVYPTSGKLISKVNVEPIPPEYVVPSGELEITANGNYDVGQYATANVATESSLKKLLDATKNAKYLCQYNITDTTGIIGYEDTSEVTDMSYMFDNNELINNVALFDTSKVTNMSAMFSGTRRLAHVPLFDTSNVTTMSSMFSASNYSSGLEEMPLFNTSKVTDMSSFIYNNTKLKYFPQLDTSNVTDMGNMFRSTNLLELPLLNTTKVKNMRSMFSYTSYKIIPAYDASNVTSLFDVFYFNSNIEQIHMYGMKVNFDLHYSTKYTREALLEIINNCATVTSTQTLTMGATNLAKLTDDDKAIATAKGWTLA